MNLSEINDKVTKLGEAFSQFKELNDRSIEELKKNGSSDPVTVEAVNKANDEITALQGEIKALKQRDDELELMNKRRGLAGGDESSAKELRKNAHIWKQSLNGVKADAPSDKDVEEYKQYSGAFASYLRYPENSKFHSPEVKAALSVGSDSDGGFWVPTETSLKILKRLFDTTPMRQVANVMTTVSAEIEFPKDVNSATSGGWVAETGTINDTATPEVGMHTIPVHDQYAQPKTTQKFLDDASINVEEWLIGKITDILSRTENAAFVTGTGVGQPRGVLSYGTSGSTSADDSRAWGVLQYVVTGLSAGFPTISGLVADDANPLINLVYSLKQAYRKNAKWMMSRLTEAEIRKLRDAEGRYLWQPGLVAGQPATLLGYEVVEGEDMPEIAADSFSAAFGDWKEGYTIVDRMGIRILRDPFTNKPFVKFYTTKRVGGDVTNFDALKLLKFGTS